MDLKTTLDVAETVVSVGSTIVTGASAIAAVTPTETDNKVLAVVRRVLDFLALNIGFAKRK